MCAVPLVDDSNAASLPFATAALAPANLSNSARPLDQIAGIWIDDKRALQLAVLSVIEKVCDLPGERGRFEERQHPLSLYANGVQNGLAASSIPRQSRKAGYHMEASSTSI